MPTINFDICPSADCATLLFYETTCRQPDVSTGYGQTEDETQYTGLIEIFDASGQLVFSYEVEPSAVKQPHLIAIEEQTSELMGGFYRARYTVKDQNGDLIGYKEGLFSLLCAITCEAEGLAKGLCKSCCKDKLAPALSAYRENMSASLVLAQMGNHSHAQMLYNKACAAVLNNNNCNC